MMYLEDFVVGAEREFGHYEVTEEEVIAFGNRYDNQPFISTRRPLRTVSMAA